jgi:hypothetical protein
MSSKSITAEDIIASNTKNSGSVLIWGPNNPSKLLSSWVNILFLTVSGKKVPCRLEINLYNSMESSETLSRALDILRISFSNLVEEITKATRNKAKDHEVREVPFHVALLSLRYEEEKRERAAIHAKIFQNKLPSHKKGWHFGPRGSLRPYRY